MKKLTIEEVGEIGKMTKEQIESQLCEICGKRLGNNEAMKDADLGVAHKTCVKQLSKYHQRRWY